jgi:hypothetical protein
MTSIRGLIAGLGDDHSLDGKLSCGPRISKVRAYRLAEAGGGNKERLDGQCSRVLNDLVRSEVTLLQSVDVSEITTTI